MGELPGQGESHKPRNWWVFLTRIVKANTILRNINHNWRKLLSKTKSPQYWAWLSDIDICQLTFGEKCSSALRFDLPRICHAQFGLRKRSLSREGKLYCLKEICSSKKILSILRYSIQFSLDYYDQRSWMFLPILYTLPHHKNSEGIQLWKLCWVLQSPVSVTVTVYHTNTIRSICKTSLPRSLTLPFPETLPPIYPDNNNEGNWWSLVMPVWPSSHQGNFSLLQMINLWPSKS